MTLLFRYLARNNAQLLLPTLALGIGIYILTDLFERLDNFIEADVPFQVVAIYFIVKIPLVISQLLPVIFLLSAVIQLCLMDRSRELTALQAGGISLAVAAKALIICGAFWGCVQLGFSEWIGIAGERKSSNIWQEDVRKKNLAAIVLHNVWFTEGDWVISIGSLNPNSTGNNLTGYKFSEGLQTLDQIVQAPTFTATPGNWQLRNAEIHTPSTFTRETKPLLELQLAQNPATFRLVQNTKPQQLPLWHLGDTIDKLRAAGSNVEALRTAWHMKLSYAFSLVVMAMLAVAIVSWSSNIYVAAAMSLVCTFLFYALYTIGTSLGELGALPPFLAAWGANIVAMLCASVRLAPLFVTYFSKRNRANFS